MALAVVASMTWVSIWRDPGYLVAVYLEELALVDTL